MARSKADPAAALAARIIQALEEQRNRGAGAYPLTLAQLPALVGAETTPAQIAKALGRKPFAARLVVADKKTPDSPLVLAEDAAVLADSPLLLRFALNGLCTAAKPLQPFSKVEGRVGKPLKAAFAAALRRRWEANSWPSGVAALAANGKPHLYLEAYPPPPETVLPARLVRALQARKERGGAAYPATLRDLAEELAPAAPQTVAAALAHRSLKGEVVVGMAGTDAPVALAADVVLLTDSPALLTAALTAARKPDNQALPPKDIKKAVGKTLQAAFERSLRARLESNSLPDGVVCLRIKKTPHLVLWQDIAGAPQVRPAPPASQIAPGLPGVAPAPRQAGGYTDGASFARLFDEAFARLDRARGGNNLVSLVELRRALPAERSAFDQELKRLRREGLYSLAAAEGRHGLGDEERQAALIEDGTLLLFVSRRL